MSPHEFLDYLNKEKIRLDGIIPQTYSDGVPNLLHNEIMVWLQNNKDLSHEDRLDKIKLTLFERTQWHELLHYAAVSFITLEALLKESNELQGHIMTGVKGGKEIAEHLELERKKQSGKNANEERTEKFKGIEEELKQHWKNNITRDKRATDAAILLEKTDVFNKSNLKPKRSTLEGYVRKWQKENLVYDVKSDFTA